jgi:2,4-dienoyl-CoA reductase-like NADH-dependent reductase (Old Yellow Enzyme family)
VVPEAGYAVPEDPRRRVSSNEISPLFSALTFRRGPAWRNRVMLAPMTNYQSHADGRVSDDERRWLAYRAEGGFGMVMTCAAHVQRGGQGFAGQLGVFSDEHLPGLADLAADLRAHGAVGAIQLQHSGIRARSDLTQLQPVGPSEDAATGARALSCGEVERLIEDFAAAAARAERAGFDGAELHGAHGYLLCEFLSPELNRRADRWGGSLERRARVLVETIEAVRRRTGPGFQLGLRLSPERYGLRFEAQRELAAWMLARDDLDYLDMSLWDCFAKPEDAGFSAKRLVDWFAELPRSGARLGVAGHVRSGADAAAALAAGADFVGVGYAGVLHHDFPLRLAQDSTFAARPLPVTEADLCAERVGAPFRDYFRRREGFVRAETSAA